jgi:hypothetical protein
MWVIVLLQQMRPVRSSVGNVAGKGHLFIAARIAQGTATLFINVRAWSRSYRANCYEGDPWFAFLRPGFRDELSSYNHCLCGTFVRRCICRPEIWSDGFELVDLADAMGAIRSLAAL